MEEWRDIKAYPGYQVSNTGQIRSHNKITYTQRHGVRHWKDRVLKLKKAKDGRIRVTLWRDGQAFTELVHRLVAISFLAPPQDPQMTVNHKDGNPSNNTPDNLEWLSRADNIKYGFDHKQYPSHPITLIDEKGNKYDFRSMSACDMFLKKCRGYSKGCLQRGEIIVSRNGEKYQGVAK